MPVAPDVTSPEGPTTAIADPPPPVPPKEGLSIRSQGGFPLEEETTPSPCGVPSQDPWVSISPPSVLVNLKKDSVGGGEKVPDAIPNTLEPPKAGDPNASTEMLVKFKVPPLVSVIVIELEEYVELILAPVALAAEFIKEDN